MTIKLDVPNLDGATTDPADLEEFAKSLDRLSAYATTKANAMRARIDGQIDKAQRYEDQCEMVYNLLPRSWRW